MNEREKGGVPDDALIRTTLAGDDGAFGELVERYKGRAFAVAVGIVGDGDDALDVVQDSFIKAYYKLKAFRFGSNFYTWFYRLLVNQAIDRWRKSARSAEVVFFAAYRPAAPGGGCRRVLGAATALRKRINPARCLMALHMLPLRVQLNLVQRRPFDQQPHRARRHSPGNRRKVCNRDDDLITAILRMEVRRHVIVEEHPYDYAVEATDFRHRKPNAIPETRPPVACR
jgi:RNA polymerase sigma factor (sigma-70 family)